MENTIGCDASRANEHQRLPANYQREAWSRFSLTAAEGGNNAPERWPPTSSPQSCEAAHAVRKPPSWRCLLWPPQKPSVETPVAHCKSQTYSFFSDAQEHVSSIYKVKGMCFWILKCQNCYFTFEKKPNILPVLFPKTSLMVRIQWSPKDPSPHFKGEDIEDHRCEATCPRLTRFLERTDSSGVQIPSWDFPTRFGLHPVESLCRQTKKKYTIALRCGREQSGKNPTKTLETLLHCKDFFKK